MIARIKTQYDVNFVFILTLSKHHNYYITSIYKTGNTLSHQKEKNIPCWILTIVHGNSGIHDIIDVSRVTIGQSKY